jgi:hypothetical protein
MTVKIDTTCDMRTKDANLTCQEVNSKMVAKQRYVLIIVDCFKQFCYENAHLPLQGAVYHLHHGQMTHPWQLIPLRALDLLCIQPERMYECY